MKRRKKLWIACAAVAVVVASCAVALFYRPVPHQFMVGAHWEETQIPSMMPGTAFRTYTLHGEYDSVVDQAKAELRAEDGWRTVGSAGNGSLIIANDDRDEDVHLADGFGEWGTEPDWVRERRKHPQLASFVTVIVTEKATPLDRFLNWIHNR